MKSYWYYELCVLAIAVPCVLVAVGKVISCFAAMLVVIITFAWLKDHPKLWRRLYRKIELLYMEMFSE